MYITLNACIGLSSAPFYQTNIPCDRGYPSPDCSSLRVITSFMRFFEITGAVLLTCHAVLIMIVKEHSRRHSFHSFLIKVTAWSFPVYLIVIVIRIGLFIGVMNHIDKINPALNGGFGSFLAAFEVTDS